MNKKSIIQLVKSVIREEIENDENALYVEYIKDMPGEEPFMLGGQKFQYVMAKYPSGKKDIGVYAFAGDVVYGYNTFRKQHNIAEASNIEPLSGDEMDLAAPGPRDRTEPSLSSKGAKPLAPVLLRNARRRHHGSGSEVI